MKSLSIIFLRIILMLFCGGVVQAECYENGFEICESMSFQSSKKDCIKRVRKYEYFDAVAVNVCLGMSFDEGKKGCILNIGDKTYDSYEIIDCEESYFDSGKNQCLKASGRRIPTDFGC